MSITGLYFCGENRKRPQDNQHFTLRFNRDIALANMQDCFDSYDPGEKRPVKMGPCHNGQGSIQLSS